MTETVMFDGSLDSWRIVARSAIVHDLAPDRVFWTTDTGNGGLFESRARPDAATTELRVPRPFMALAASVSCHRDENRWSALYAVLWRLMHGEPHLLSVASDPAVHRLIHLHRAVSRAAHKMKAFVRFRRVAVRNDDPDYVAWFEPAHLVVDRVAPFFARRFPSMRWSILTPERSVHWDRTTLSFAVGVTRAGAPRGDELEELWRTYYANIFNPARLNTRAMRAEMPQRYWAGLPEARVIATLTSGASERVSRMLEQTFAAPEALPADCVPTAQDSVKAPPTADGWDSVYDPGSAEAQLRERAARCPGATRAVVNGSVVSLGVAGWTDPSLLVPGLFYPRGCSTPEQRLRYYASRFSMVEVDATYYTPPTRAMSAAWSARTPKEFRFNIKAHALMTGHPTDARRLPEWLRRELPRSANGDARIYSTGLPRPLLDEVWSRFRAALDPLRSADKLGAIMLQFPRWFRPTRENADSLIRARELLGDDLATVEFRQRAWMTGRVAERTLALLRELRLSYVIVDAPPGMESSMPPTVAVTDPRLAVCRLHGRRVSTWEAKNDPVTERYRYLYDHGQLRQWIPAVREMAHQASAVHLTFNNNHANYATTNALEMAQFLAEG